MKISQIRKLIPYLKPGILGIAGDNELLLCRVIDPSSPLVKYLLTSTAWSKVKGFEDVLQAYPTLENYTEILQVGLYLEPTERFKNWLRQTVFIPDLDFKNSPLFDYQQEAVRFLYRHDRALLALSPGLGKTLTSSYAAGLCDFKNVLAVVPASLLYYWVSELEKWADKLPVQPFVTVLHRDKAWTNADRFPEAKQHWFITNPETVVSRWDKIDWSMLPSAFDCMVVDESIMYKHRNSQRSKAIKDLASEIPVCWLLSGAPATRYLDDMWHQFHILKPKGYSSYWRFAKKYCVVEETQWGENVVANKLNAEKEIKTNFQDIYFSRTQDDVADIPDWIFEEIDIQMPKKQDKAYETLREELYIQLDSVDPNEKITVNNHLSLMIRSIQVASNPLLVGGVNSAGKWDALPELMEIYPGPWIVWVNFIKTGEILRDNLPDQRKTWPTKSGKLLTALANGSTSMQDRNSMVDTFQKGEIDVLILNNQVGKFGFTITKARTSFFLERTYDDSYFQCLHRNRRIGTVQSPMVVNLLSLTQSGKRTIDHTINSVLDYRTGMIKKITAGELRETFKK